MRRIFVTADVHSDEKALAILLDKAVHARAELFIVAGDLCPKSPEIAIMLQNAPFQILVSKGNCDWLWDYRDSGMAIPQEACLVDLDDERHIGICHGHNFPSPADFPYHLKAGDIFITGHSHVPHLYVDDEGIINLNPGSPSRPRSSQGASYAMIADGKIEVRRLSDDRTILSLAIE